MRGNGVQHEPPVGEGVPDGGERMDVGFVPSQRQVSIETRRSFTPFPSFDFAQSFANGNAGHTGKAASSNKIARHPSSRGRG